ncbi:MAG: transcriptional regulator Spx, partial [Bacilli bacterium]|nr:transcriptional regulator Spx [Bacilli bacterium]
MIKILVSPSCASCRKVRKWFDDNKIPYEMVNIFSDALKREDIKEAITK